MWFFSYLVCKLKIVVAPLRAGFIKLESGSRSRLALVPYEVPCECSFLSCQSAPRPRCFINSLCKISFMSDIHYSLWRLIIGKTGKQTGRCVRRSFSGAERGLRWTRSAKRGRGGSGIPEKVPCLRCERNCSQPSRFKGTLATC